MPGALHDDGEVLIAGVSSSQVQTDLFLPNDRLEYDYRTVVLGKIAAYDRTCHSAVEAKTTPELSDEQQHFRLFFENWQWAVFRLGRKLAGATPGLWQPKCK